MTTFFVIFSVLVLVNAALLLHSSITARNSARKAAKHIAEQTRVKIYQIDLHTSNYKKAI